MKPRSIRCMKFFLTLFNIVCILFGLILMAICAMNMRERKSRPEQQSALSRGVLAFLLTLGLALVVTAVLGCIGALREHVKILYVHACFFIFLVSVELIVGVGGAVLSAWVGAGSELRVQFYRNATVDDDHRHQEFWDQLQAENQCCGVDGPQDYAILNRPIPPACCARAHPLREGGARSHLHQTCLTDRSYYVIGCEEALRQKKALKGNIFISTGVIFALLEIFCIVLALWMARTIRSERRKLQQNLQAHFET
ncbi:23 kDa integral membrane protein-like [Pectinophora gossypiella]|uniref:23 kDa integral membrane protein-like n=1 Tax=Pectinophora gossypiella TaxID=13191 RepID=UPI00214E0D90|nr:23 kDa integral membrane protein-like [Pectinophora gossypiella]